MLATGRLSATAGGGRPSQSQPVCRSVSHRRYPAFAPSFANAASDVASPKAFLSVGDCPHLLSTFYRVLRDVLMMARDAQLRLCPYQVEVVAVFVRTMRRCQISYL